MSDRTRLNSFETNTNANRRLATQLIRAGTVKGVRQTATPPLWENVDLGRTRARPVTRLSQLPRTDGVASWLSWVPRAGDAFIPRLDDINIGGVLRLHFRAHQTDSYDIEVIIYQSLLVDNFNRYSDQYWSALRVVNHRGDFPTLIDAVITPMTVANQDYFSYTQRRVPTQAAEFYVPNNLANWTIQRGFESLDTISSVTSLAFGGRPDPFSNPNGLDIIPARTTTIGDLAMTLTLTN